MFLRFVFLLITRVGSWLRLSQRKEAWKTAEILILRHQLAVLHVWAWMTVKGVASSSIGSWTE
jgi:hypothetical protein